MPTHTIAVISDTHMPSRGRELPEPCRDLIVDADLLIHAGDVSDGAALSLMETLGPPLVAVHGNVDDAEVRRHLPPERAVEVGGVVLAVTHDAGAADGRLERLRRRFPRCDAVIFGHSHIPMHRVADDGFAIINPGSPTDRRRQPRHTMALILIEEGRIMEVAFHAVDDPPGPLPAALVAT